MKFRVIIACTPSEIAFHRHYLNWPKAAHFPDKIKDLLCDNRKDNAVATHPRLIFEPVAAKGAKQEIVYLKLDKPAQTQVVSNEAVRKTYQELAGYFQEGDLRLNLWTSVREGTELAVDEPLAIYLKANKNGYFVLFSRNSEGEIDLIFPLTAQDDNLLVADSPFDFTGVTLSPPLGLEVLFAFAAEDKAELSTQKALEVFEIYYQTRIAQKVEHRSIRRKRIAVDWTWLYSVPPR